LTWSVGSIDVELEAWEDALLSDAATAGPLFLGPNLERLQRQLAGLGRGVALNLEACRTLTRRAEVQADVPRQGQLFLTATSATETARSHEQRRVIRESFDLLASTTAGQQYLLAQQRADRDSTFQVVVSLLAAVFVAPSLVAAVYGANVRGLPGYERTDGLWFMLSAAVIAALLTAAAVAVLPWLRHRRSRAATAAVSARPLSPLSGAVPPPEPAPAAPSREDCYLTDLPSSGQTRSAIPAPPPVRRADRASRWGRRLPSARQSQTRASRTER
jgi:CorA-like Mg2+ transporter protein